MRIFLSLLMLLAGLNQILSRSLYSKSYEPFSNVWFINEDNDPSDITFNHFADDFFAGDSSEESLKTFFPSESNKNADVDNFFNSLVNTLFDDDFGNTLNHDQNLDSNENISSDNDDNNKKENNNAESLEDLIETDISHDSKNDDELEKVVNSLLSTFLLEGFRNIPNHDQNMDSNEDISFHDKVNKHFPIYLYDPSSNMFEKVKPTSFVGETNQVKGKAKGFNDDEDHSDEVTTRNPDVEVFDLTKSSEEEKSGLDADLSKKDIEELTDLLITLIALDDVIKIANTVPEYNDDKLNADKLKSKEVDEYLKLLSSILDTVLEEELRANESTTLKNKSDEDDDNNDHRTTHKNDSDEENNYSTTPKTDSDEESDSEENIVFRGIDGSAEQRKNINDHKYEVIETSQELRPTTAPLGFESANPSSLDDHNVMKEYAEIRENLDSQQDNLQKHQLSLDKDFYTITSSNYDEENMKKFENDIFGLRDDLDRIKRNINAMQGIHTKLYFHQLISAAVKDAKERTDKEKF